MDLMSPADLISAMAARRAVTRSGEETNQPVPPPKMAMHAAILALDAGLLFVEEFAEFGAGLFVEAGVGEGGGEVAVGGLGWLFDGELWVGMGDWLWGGFRGCGWRGSARDGLAGGKSAGERLLGFGCLECGLEQLLELFFRGHDLLYI